ncbi:MAG: hypothetical protein ACFFCW_39950 [Candidatus Hodarchaeota archaeon]
MRIRIINKLLWSTIIIIFLIIFLSGYVTTYPNLSAKDLDWNIITKPNLSIIDEKKAPSKTKKGDAAFIKTKSLLLKISGMNSLLAIELGKLPDLLDGVSPSEAAAIEEMVVLYNNDPGVFNSAFREMYSVGLPEVRKYSSPLQALFWLAEEGTLKKGKNPLIRYSLHKLLKKAWTKIGFKGKRWEDFEVVADRLNAPELLDYYIDHNFKKIKLPESKSHNVYDVFVRKEGWCGELAMFGVKILKRAGYNADLYWDMAWPKPSYGRFAVSGHTVAAYVKDGLRCVFVDFTRFGNYLHECMDKKKWAVGDDYLFEDERIKKRKARFQKRYILRTEPLPGWSR